MNFGLSAPTSEKVGDLAVEVEKLGYDAIFRADHIGGRMYDPWITLAYIAAKTTTLRLGTIVTAVTRYVPGYLAQLISTVDVLSKGRTIAGFGAGHNIAEYVNYSPQGVYPKPRERVAQYKEALQLIRRLWIAPPYEEVNFEGKYYTMVDAHLFPPTVQKPHPPIWQGGGGNYMLKIAAEYCDGWIGMAWGALTVTPEEYEAKVKKIKNHAKKINRDMSKFTFVVGGMSSAEMIEEYKTAGAQFFNFDTRAASLEKYVELMQKYATEIIPSFK